MSDFDAPLIGIDLVDPQRLRDRLERSPALRDELFHPGEIAYSETQPSPIECLAGRFAAKEAVVKALGLDGFDPLDVEVVAGGERCSVRLHGAAAERATKLGVSVAISMSHLVGLAAAVAQARPGA
jgi:holo-[acyl-carrier protein] synthase